MTLLRYSPSGAGLAFSTLLIGSALLLASLSAVVAAPAAPSKTQAAATGSEKAKVAAAAALNIETDGPATGSTKPMEGAGCLRSRRKLWVDGEGWIVRRVTLCQ